MIFRNLYKAVFILSILCTLASCEELFNESETGPDGSVPFVRLQAPNDNSVFKIGQNVKIVSTISDKDGIQEMDVKVVKVSDGAASQAVWGYKKFPTTNPVIVDTLIAANNLTAGEYLLRLNLIDKRTNVQVKEVHFTVK